MTDKEFRILMVEDSPTDAELTEHELRRARISFSLRRVQTEEDFIKELHDFKPDIILSDYHLPTFTGSEALSIAAKEAPEVPFILITGALGEERAVEILKSGATDYVLKDRLSRLSHAVVRALQEADEKEARKRAEKLLSASEATLRNIIEKNADGIIVVSHNGVVCFVNPAAETLFGREAKKLIGNPFGFPIIAGEITEMDYLRNGGEIKTLEMNVVETTWEGENAYLASLRDVTEHKRILMELEQTRQQQLRLKDEFLSHVSHELRSPLTAIHQFVTILLDGLAGDLNPEQREYMEIALKNVHQLQNMISDLVEITRAETGKLTIEPERMSIAKVIDETCSSLKRGAAAKGIMLSVDLQENMPFAYADPVRIKQVLYNLIDNGIKFTPGNGVITVRARISEQDPDFLCCSVADTGYGISIEDQEKIFDRLYQAKQPISQSRKGLGLGLHICRELVSRHGGKIWVESRQGHGSTFSFTLPIFSLARLIAPVLTPENLLKGSVALISIQLFSPVNPGPTKTRSDEIILREVQNVLTRCILPDLDVLLPRMADRKTGDIFFMLACADQTGTEVLVRRIKGQLAYCKNLQETFPDYTVSFSIIKISPEKINIPSGHLADEIADKIESLTKEVTETHYRFLPKGKNSVS
jgi:signal transduction histidine kinase/FixJ family two-component response regulator